MLKSKNEQKNLERWASTSPKAAILLPYIDCRHLVFCETKKGELNLKNTFGNKTSYFHSSLGALDEAEKWFSSLSLDNTQVLYVYGIGLGYYYQAAKSWLKNSNHSLVFLEDDLGVIHRLFETEMGTEILQHPQVKLYYIQDLHQTKEVFENLYWDFAMQQILVSALNLYSKQKSHLFSQIRHKILYEASVKNALLDEYLKHGTAFFRNFYPNMLAFEGSYLGNQLFGKFENIPAIICGAGPSLEKHLPLLKNLHHQALIFAGGSALNALNASNILPHFGAGIDPNAPQLDRLMNNQAFEIPFFYRNRMHHQAFLMIHGPRLYITGSGGYDIADWFEERLNIKGELLDEGHNVVNFCLEIANALGCNPIIFVGMDLAYTGMRSYAPGVEKTVKITKKSLINKADPDQEALLWKDVEGKPIYTLWKWIAEADWIGEYSKEHPHLTILNATEGGIGFPGVPNVKLKDVIKTICTQNFDLKGRIHGEIQNHPISHVTRDQVFHLVYELRDSLIRCVQDLEILIEENEKLKKKNSKDFTGSLITGRSALYEDELTQEVGYLYVLSVFNVAYSRLLNGQLHQANLLKSETQKKRRKLMLNQERLRFLREVAQTNLILIDGALEE